MNYPLNIRRNEWENLDDKEQSQMKLDIIDYFRTNGFPHFKYDIIEQYKELERLDKYMKNNDLEKDGIIRQTMHGVGVCWSYHPHHWSIRCGNNKTPMEVFESNELLGKAIKKRMKSGSHINEAMMRKTFKVSGGAQAVSNFRPSVARWIYDKYAGEGMVYDPCMGFGGRLLGAISSPKVKHYEGCDPSTETYNGLMRMCNTFENRGTVTVPCRIGAEEYRPFRKFDLVFTSPPYYNTEKYSTEKTQSYIKYPTYDQWMNGFLNKLIYNSMECLKKGGYFIINVANTKYAKTLEYDFMELMKWYNVKLIKEYRMALSLQHSGGKFKYEPIFVFQKV